MAAIESITPITLKNILYLTDFSAPSKAALPCAMTMARNYGAVIHALHVLVSARHDCINPDLRAAFVRADEELAQTEMGKLGSELAGITHQTIVERGVDIWPAIDKAIKDHGIDLVVLGTHGRSGSLRLGSAAEEIYHRSPVPVLTIGPACTAALTTVVSVACFSPQISRLNQTPPHTLQSRLRKEITPNSFFCMSSMARSRE